MWGESIPQSDIVVVYRGTDYHTRTDSDGHWRLELDSQPPGGPYIIEIKVANSGDYAGNSENIVINNVYIGDVWLCSGQSNMELSMQRLKDNFPEEWNFPVNSLIRQFKVPQKWDFSGPQRELSGGAWRVASEETLNEFSGTAWFFAREIFKKYNVPIGLINAAWGGTTVEAWMSREGLAAFPEKIALGEKYADAALCDEITRKNEAENKAWEDKIAGADTGIAEAWHKPETDSSQWASMNLPGAFAEASISLKDDERVGGDFCGVIWLRREFEADAEFAGKAAKVWLGTIVDADTVYVNGVEVGNTTYRYPPRKYLVPAGLLHEGKNEIVIRVVCNNGGGAITRGKDFRIFSQSGNIELEGIWKFRAGVSVEPRPASFFFQGQPTGLFNAMIAPVLDYPCKGILWYQGESNDANPAEYSALFTALINDWRNKKRIRGEQGNVPFLFVQLPVFGEPEENNESSSWALIRDAQRSALALPETGMATGLDLGEWNDLHPLNKKDVGRRLALAAERVVYKKENTAPGPLYSGAYQRQGRLFFTFDNCGEGLCADGKPYVTIVSGGSLIRLPAEIEGTNGLSIDISSVSKPEKALYAWANNPQDRQLYNKEGLPVIPFKCSISD